MNQRARPVEQQLPVEVDIGFTDTVQCNPGTCEQIKSEYLFLPSMSQNDQHLLVFI